MLTFFSKPEVRVQAEVKIPQERVTLGARESLPVRRNNIVRQIEFERSTFNYNQPKEHWATHLILGERRYRELCAYLQAIQRVTQDRCEPVRPSLYEGLRIILCEDPDRVEVATTL